MLGSRHAACARGLTAAFAAVGFRHGGDALARRRVHHVRALQRSRTLRVRDEAHDGRRRHRQLAQGAQGTNRGVAIGLICSKHRFSF